MFTVTQTINAPVEKVWAALADIGSIYKWNPGVVDSHRENEKEGLGGCRHCDLGGKNYLKEEVVRWEPKQALTMRITKTNLPFKDADIRFTLLEKNGITEVSVSPLYHLKYGVLGQMLDAIYVRKTYRKGMQALADGLKKYVENEKSLQTNNG